MEGRVASVNNVINLATENPAMQRARAEIVRAAKLVATEADKGEALDECAASLRRAADEADRALRTTFRRGRRWDAIVDEIYRRAADPWVALRLGMTALVELRIGSYAVAIGPEGAGKSSLMLQILMQHERDVGPAILVTPELDADEAGARAIGQDRGASWREVLEGKVPRDQLRPRARFSVLEREDATIRHLETEVAALSEEFPNEPILVAWDYLQASPGDGEGERLRIAKISTDLRKAAKRLRCVIIGVSQSSRDGAKKLTSGELLGAEASRTGAESSQIERDAYATIAIGDNHTRDDGTESRSISIGKNRMGAGDVVFTSVYDGRTGHWRIEQAARPAAEVRDERKGRDQAAAVGNAEVLVLDYLQKSSVPVTRDLLREVTKIKKEHVGKAVASLLARGDIVEVDRKMPRSRSYMLWTRAQADAAGVGVVTGGESE